MEASQRKFVESARLHGLNTVGGDAIATNEAYDAIATAREELRDAPDKGVHFLRGLLSDGDLSVVTWAALFLLPFDEASATEALGRVADSGAPRFALGARMTLREWQAGRLTVQ